MIKVYDYCCKKCWHMWKSKNKYTFCPVCKSKNIDLKTDISLEDINK